MRPTPLSALPRPAQARPPRPHQRAGPRWPAWAPLALALAAGGVVGCGSSWSPPDTNQSSFTPKDTSAALPCTTDEDCAEVPRGPCELALCDTDAGRCALRAVTDGTPCTTGDACVVGQRCQAGACRGGAPRPPCAGVQCGVDACGHDCGGCQGATECVDGVCEARACSDSTYAGCCLATGALRYCDMGATRVVDCGDLTAGGGDAMCGWAPGVGLFDCVGEAAPAPDGTYLCDGELCGQDPCAGRQCGWACGQDCGACGDGARCVDGTCVSCGCEGRVCGDDGCGEPCGQCTAGEACVDGACVDGCGPVGTVGCCEGDTLRYCDGGALRSQACQGDPGADRGAGGTGCGWRLEESWYGCGGLGADPEGLHPRACDELEPAGPEPGPEPGPELEAADEGPEPAVEALPDAAPEGEVDADAPLDADASPDGPLDADAPPDTGPDD